MSPDGIAFMIAWVGIVLLGLIIALATCWLVVSRVLYGMCAFIAFIVRMAGDEDSKSKSWMSIADELYIKIPFVQK